VAALLRAYGVEAYAHRPMTWDDVRAEVADGRPVFVWIVGSVYSGTPLFYQAGNGHISMVSPKQHVAMVIGYNKTTVTIQDGSKVYTRSLSAFLSSWSALGNMGITARP
jgi:uncharacterized protein YvpB